MKCKQNVNRRMKLMFLGIALLITTVGTTFAWWTATSQASQKVTMGKLAVAADFKPLDGKDAQRFESGIDTEVAGTIKNTGSIPALVRVDNASQIQFVYSDDQMTPIAEADRVFTDVDPQVIQMDLKAANEDYTSAEGVYWFKDSAGRCYLLMDPQTAAEVVSTIKFDGGKTTNQYMESTVDAQLKLTATQVLEGAAQAELGVDLSTLEDYTGDQPQMAMARSAATSPGKQHLMELLSR